MQNYINELQVPPECSSNVTDIQNRCCDSGLADASGACCPSGAVVDASGSCCAAGQKLDAAGICAGAAQLLDVQGAGCKAGVVDARGACCEASNCFPSLPLTQSFVAVSNPHCCKVNGLHVP